MYNHVRTLLLNLAPGQEHLNAYGYEVPSTFVPVELNGTLQEYYAYLYGTQSELYWKIFLTDRILQLAHRIPEFDELILSYDSRITYNKRAIPKLHDYIQTASDGLVVVGQRSPDINRGILHYHYVVQAADGEAAITGSDTWTCQGTSTQIPGTSVTLTWSGDGTYSLDIVAVQPRVFDSYLGKVRPDLNDFIAAFNLETTNRDTILSILDRRRDILTMVCGAFLLVGDALNEYRTNINQ